jgi:hypothetical protein
MKNSKSVNKSKKSNDVKDSAKSKKVTVRNSVTSEADIREKANEIYHQRIERGEHGTPENDWIKAEKYFSDLED